MVVFIDAYNVLKTMKGVDYVTPIESEAFVKRAQHRASMRNYYVTIVFDAGTGMRPTISQQSHLQVVYSGLQQNADDMLIQLIEQSSAPEKVLVTADRSLRKRGLSCGAQPVDPITYWRAIHSESPCKDNLLTRHHGVFIDFSIDYSVEELKNLAFSSSMMPLKDDISSRSRASASHKQSKAVKKFEKIKDKL